MPGAAVRHQLLSFVRGASLRESRRWKTFHVTVKPPVGHIHLYTHAPVVVQHIIVAPGKNVMTVQGLAPTIDSVTGERVEPPAGTLTLTGKVPIVDPLASAKGTITLTGLVPTIVT